MLIQTINLGKVYKNGIIALSDINLSIDFGEFVFLTGASGAGKSTLIRLLFREEAPTAGQILIGGRSVIRLTRPEVVRLRRNTGVVFQDFRLMEKGTVFDNVAFALKAVERPWPEIRQRVPAMLERVGLAGRENDNVMQLSGGEQQRVAIARALAKRPRLLLCDEPTGALDYQTGKQILALLQKQSRENGMTVVIITHNSALTAMADRVIRVRSGQITDVRRNEAPVPVESIEW